MTDYLRPIAAYVASRHRTHVDDGQPADHRPDTTATAVDSTTDIAVTETDKGWSR